MHPYTGEIQLAVTAETTINAEVMTSELIGGYYFYKLQANFTDGNNANTVIVKDVHQNLISQKP